MLTIRLAPTGKKQLPIYRIVLTEHSRPVKSGYQDVLGTYNAVTKDVKVDIDAVHAWIEKGASVSNRAAKIIHKETGSEEVKKFIVYTERVRKPKKED